MKFQLLEIILWSREPSIPPRRLAFREGMTNVITGASRTGKSAVIPIIDYCLGSDRCAVPVNTIRDACSWFGVLVTTAEGQKLIARREPGNQQTTGDMHLTEGVRVEVPLSAPTKNTNVAALKRCLDRLAGLSDLGFDPTEASSGFKGRPSFRDMAAFMFQPQNIIANPDVLFYKADTVEHREKLRTIFPYVLGAITPDLLAKRWELEGLQKELKRLERELAAQRGRTARWRGELASWIAEARSLGLVSDPEVVDAASETQLVNALRRVVDRSSREAVATAGSAEASSREAAVLDREEGEVALQLSEVRSRMGKMLRLRQTVDDYSGALDKQRERLELSRWLRDSQEETACAVCGGRFDHAGRELELLCDALAEIEASARQLSPVPAAFDRELVQVRSEVRRHTDALQAVRVRRRRLETRSRGDQAAALKSSSIDRFLGRAEQALTMFASPGENTELRERIETLRERSSSLRRMLSGAGLKARLDAALKTVSNYMAHSLPSLDSERPADPVELNIKELTLIVSGTSGRKDHLWEIGSGANWLSYHLAATLALHKHFSGIPTSGVPGLLVYDQPSQVYFPHTTARDAEEGSDPEYTDEDIRAVRKVFERLGAATEEMGNVLQIIVLDHAGAEAWGDIECVHLVEEWRAGQKLVPMQWLE